MVRINIESFSELEKQIRKCKLNCTCPDREMRQYYFENEKTASEYPVMFVCESPATRGGIRSGEIREECWIITKEDQHFRELLKYIDMPGAYITNFVKCGALTSCKPKKQHIEKCLPFLLAEIELVNPKLIVCVGRNAEKVIRRYLSSSNLLHYVPSYSWRRRPTYDPIIEKQKYDEILSLTGNLQSKIISVLQRTKKLAQQYYELTGRPLGITGEVAEYEAARLLGLKLAEVRQPGYDALEDTSKGVKKVQIKGRRLPVNPKPGQRIGSIRLDREWDTVILVLMGLNYEVFEIWEADRPAVEKALKAPGSKARNERGALGVSKFKSIGKLRWKQ